MEVYQVIVIIGMTTDIFHHNLLNLSLKITIFCYFSPVDFHPLNCLWVLPYQWTVSFSYNSNTWCIVFLCVYQFEFWKPTKCWSHFAKLFRHRIPMAFVNSQIFHINCNGYFFPTLLWYHFCSVECFFFTALISTIIFGLLLWHHHYPLPFLSKAFSLQCYTRRVQSRVLIFQLTSIGLFALLEKQGRGKLFFVLTWRRPTQRKKRCPQRINSPNFKLSSP